MKRIRKAILSCSLLSAQMLVAQANISTPAPKDVATSDCHPTPSVRPDGTVEFTGCSQTKAVVERSKIDPAAKSPGTAAGSGTEVKAVGGVSAETQAKYEEALRAQYEYTVYSYAHAKRTFDYQYWSGEVIFLVVLLIVLAGLVFSGVQFYLGVHHPVEGRRNPGVKDTPSPEAPVSEFEATLSGIKLKSSVLGLLILAMSMVFFFLYLKYVYPITNVGQ